MRYLGYQRMGTVPILDVNDRYQLSSTNWPHPELGHYNLMARVLDISSGLATQRTRGLSPVVRKTMAVDGTYKAKLVEKRNHLPKTENKTVNTHNHA